MKPDVKNVLVVGSGGIVIGQAAEFDYSGSQVLKALKEEGIRSVLVNPNVATIQTSLRMADRVYLEPITHDVLERIVEKENIDGILLGFGGQTALNAGIELHRQGTLTKYNIRVLGSNIRAIEISEDRQLFNEFIDSVCLEMPECGSAESVDGASSVARRVGFPVLVRTSYTLGGTGAGVVKNDEELRATVQRALKWSWNNEVMVRVSSESVESYLHKIVQGSSFKDLADVTKAKWI